MAAGHVPMDKRCPVHGNLMTFEGGKNIPGHRTLYTYRCVGHFFNHQTGDETDGIYTIAVYDWEIVEFSGTDEWPKGVK